MTTIDKFLAECEARAKAATPGPWRAEARSKEDALVMAKERADERGVPGFSVDSEEFDDADIEEVRDGD